jgi:hypothetical protein
MNSALLCGALWTEVAERNAGELGSESQSTAKREYLGHIVDVAQVLEGQ